MKRDLFVLLFAVALALPGLADSSEREWLIRPSEREPAGWDVQIAPPEEPGDRLIVSGKVFWRPDSLPIRGATVYVYHVDVKGLYNRPGEDSLGPRLAGVLRTNEKGEYRFRTIMPGTYGGPPHIHFEVWGGGMPRRGLWVNVFRAPQDSASYVARHSGVETRSSRPMGGDVVPRRDSSGVFRCTWDLRVGSGFQLP